MNTPSGVPAASAGKPQPLSLLIVDDSPVARAVLTRMLSAYPDFEVAAVAGNAGEALSTLREIAVDIILLDIEMPGMTGLDALPEILRAGKGARVIIVSSLAEHGAQATVKALALGAADTLPKPGVNAFAGRFSEILADRLRRIGRADRSAGTQPAKHKGDHVQLRPPGRAEPTCLAIGASTGGLHALSCFFDKLPQRIGVPILVTQHLPAAFMPYFARQLEGMCGRPVAVAEEGMALLADHVLVAPGDGHLMLDRKSETVRVRIDRAPAASGCLPSVDPMLQAVAEVYGDGGLAVILSGMGRDGLIGGHVLVDRGGVAMVQDPQSCAVWGMPRAVAEAGLAAVMAPPGRLAEQVAERIGSRVSVPAWK